MNWLTEHKIPLGAWMETFVNWLVNNASSFFDMISNVLGTMITSMVDALMWIPPLAVVAIVVVGVWFLHKNVGLMVFIAASMLLIMNLGYWQDTVETLVMVISATAFSVLIGVPIGIAAAHRPWLYMILRPILDLMQTIPTFVYLIPTLILFGLGYVPGLISTIIFAIAAPIRLTYLGVSKVPNELLEAGLAFGCTKSKLLYKVELPAAMPSIMAGVTQCIMLSLSMVVVAALVGANGLGRPVVQALNTINISQGFEAGVSIVLVAIMLDRICKTPSMTREG
ncbi:Glycine betaine transport system permease protein OpuAB [Marinomonas spartinae]|uniref:Glycine betaine transport system permease protein OpuAB n=1 Tax=Marinomonas spartinae TaxID=1792290 RepID=A0A1A8T6Z7_9GAMM|nr:choline ABC transporter permease subunit [Marinomonas spartinae]SBS28265.1 Glycine betaine transport system permease protein OpuAB [Marinomonas spartinae]SBS28396.1 Glycine betaine transport system permease protein OpuAB [Marinomonas spartinae]